MTVRKRRIQKRDLLIQTEGVFEHAVDATLGLLAYVTSLSTPTLSNNSAFKARLDSEVFLRSVNYETIKNALITARRKRYVIRRRRALPEITHEGKKRLHAAIPQYDESRIWDGRLHMISYDIPEKHRKARDLLRLQLRQLNCVKLQASVWLTPYNPIDMLRAFVAKKGIEGAVIVSDLGKDASVGEETIEELIVRLYDLKTLNARYVEWLDNFSDRPDSFDALAGYMTILKDDPQLPFALLPKWWKGEYAFRTIQPVYSSLLFHSRPRAK